MPTADQFEAAARRFADLADDLDTLLASTPSHLGPDTLIGGRLTLVADLTIDTAMATAVHAGRRVRELAGSCRRRAAICRSHAADVDAYLRELQRFQSGEVPMARPIRPRRPATWVEI